MDKLTMMLALIGLMGISAVLVNNKIAGTIVCFGDSITHGAKVNGHSWVYLLSKEHAGINFVNEGRNGRKTADRKELLPVLRKYKKAEAFLIFLGVNDLKDGNDSMVANCVTNMEWMINKIRNSNPRAKIVILSPCEINLRTMSPLNVRKKYNMNTEMALVALEKSYRRLAKEESVEFISLLRVVSPANYADGLHPNAAGQQEIAAAVWKGLSKLVR